ncbi:MAG: pseudouridine synthase, partial [Gammaproteobacteria bacterium]|nr:pseudouridine synthase [Gammaproteobacteria bacterium]
MTSATVVNKIKKILNVKKAGHAGTLDPLASGV